jgi:predicted polyphosphate/ATP-dependent NAD kinase
VSSRTRRIGFLINPIAGMGGRVGLKGTDNMAEEARRRGAMPVANARAAKMLSSLKQRLAGPEGLDGISWLTCSGDMGADALAAAGFDRITIVYQPKVPPTADDTRQAVVRHCQIKV